MANDFASTGQSAIGALHPKPNTPWEERRAARTVAHHAIDAEDCAELLEMLGLDPKKGKAPEMPMVSSTPPRRAVQRQWNPHKRKWTQK